MLQVVLPGMERRTQAQGYNQAAISLVAYSGILQLVEESYSWLVLSNGPKISGKM